MCLQGLGLVACTADGQEGRLDKRRSACALRFEFYQSDEEVADAAGKGLHSVCVPDVHLRSESSHELCMQLATKHRVPARLRCARPPTSYMGSQRLLRVLTGNKWIRQGASPSCHHMFSPTCTARSNLLLSVSD